MNECESNPCQNGGSCLDRFNMFVCECPPGYSGPVCDTNVRLLKFNPFISIQFCRLIKVNFIICSQRNYPSNVHFDLQLDLKIEALLISPLYRN